MGIKRHVDTLLVGEQPVGTWLLVFLNSAREVLTEEDALKISDAVRAVDLVMLNEPLSSENSSTPAIDALFADLINREPPKPASLLALEKNSEQKHIISEE
jgi:hydrogenase expression/formation protein HypC